VIVCIAYYLGARLGFALTLRPYPISTLWPPNSILLAGLLLTPVNWWWVVLLGAIPAHLAVELSSGVPPAMVVGWFVSNSSEALLGAGIMRHLLKGAPRFDRSHDVGVFVGAVFVAVSLSGILDAGFVSLSGVSAESFPHLWRTRFFSNVLAALTLVPVILTWSRQGFADLRSASPARFLETIILLAGLLVVSIIVFNQGGPGAASTPALLYAPLPFVLWAAIRLDPRGTSTALLIITASAIWGAVHGNGPFLTSSPADNARFIQLFFSVFSIPLLALSAVTRERQDAVDTARESQEQLDRALCASQTGTCEWRISEDRWSMSSQARQILGLDESVEVRRLSDFLTAVAPEDRGIVSELLRGSVDQGHGFECEFRPAAGTGDIRWVLCRGEVIYDKAQAPDRFVAAIVDVTDRKQTEKLRQDEMTLRVSEGRLRELADAMPQIIWTATGDGRLDYFNRSWYELTGGTESMLEDQTWMSMTHPDDQQTMLELWQQAAATGEPFEVEHRLQVRETGAFRWHLARARPIRDGGGTVVRWYGSCTDIQDYKVVEGALRDVHTELEHRVEERTSDLSAAVLALRDEIGDRMAAERALRSSEQRFSKAFHSSPDAIVIVRQKDYRFVEVNEKWEAMFGYSRAQVIGRSGEELGLSVYEEQREWARAHLADPGPKSEIELEARTRSGDTLQVLLRSDSLEMAGEPCYIISLRDVSARKRAESAAEEQRRELAHLSRVASLGELSGALAHELNQPLAAILANVRAAQRLTRESGPELKELRDILEDIAVDDRRAGEVIGRLRALLKKGEARMSEVHLNAMVAEVTGLLHSDLIRRRVSIRTDLAPSLPLVLGERVELQQVLLNLVANACDAMMGKPADQRLVIIRSSSTPDGLVHLSVADQGDGIPHGRLEQIFDAFFTTKEHGLGLGLAICRSIATAHRGRLWAENGPSGGAIFHLALHQGDVSGGSNHSNGDGAHSER